MNVSMINKLIVKDWQLYKWYMLVYTLLGLIAAGLMTVPSGLVYYTGVVMLITVLIGASAHLAITSVVTEKKEYQFSFIMGLPIKPIDYALSKLLGGLGIYLSCWLLIVMGTIGIIHLSHLPNGMIPMVIMSALEIYAATAILLCAGILTGSAAVTIVIMVILNLCFNLFLFAVAGNPEIGKHIQSESAVFNQATLEVIGVEVLVITLAIMVTIYIKSRKACFL